MTEPRNRTSWSAPALLVLLLLLLLLLVSGQALFGGALSHAQAPPPAQPDARPSPQDNKTAVTLWDIDASSLSADERTLLERALKEALGDGYGLHLFSDASLERYLGERQPAIPDCLLGLAACATPKAMALEALNLSAQVRLRVDKAEGGLGGRFELVDGRGQVTRSGDLRKRVNSPRALGFAIVRTIYDATGTVSIVTNPPGAQVTIDGEVVGITPMSKRLAVGQHRYALALPQHKPVEGNFELRSALTTELNPELELLKGELLIEGAPVGAAVFVDNKRVGEVGKPIAIEPGNHTIEVRAEGFDTYRDMVRLTPGERSTRRAKMRRTNPLLRDISPALIALNTYMIRLSYEHTFQSTTFRGAGLRDNDRRSEFRRFVDDTGNTSLDQTNFLSPFGARLELGVFGETLGLTVLGISYVAGGADAMQAELQELSTGETVEAEVTGLRRLHLRPFQFGVRYLYKNFAPTLEGGIGINFQWIDVQATAFSDERTLSQAEAFWNLSVGGQYYFTDRIFAQARYTLQSYFNDGLGLEHQVNLGFGVAIPDLFGLDPEPPEQL